MTEAVQPLDDPAPAVDVTASHLTRPGWLPAQTPVPDLPTALARIQQLEQALVSNRAISMAVGMLMERHHVSAEIALGELRGISQNFNVRLAEVATTMLQQNND